MCVLDREKKGPLTMLLLWYNKDATNENITKDIFSPFKYKEKLTRVKDHTVQYKNYLLLQMFGLFASYI